MKVTLTHKCPTAELKQGGFNVLAGYEIHTELVQFRKEGNPLKCLKNGINVTEIKLQDYTIEEKFPLHVHLT